MKNYIVVRFDKYGSLAYIGGYSEKRIHEAMDLVKDSNYKYKVYEFEPQKLIEVGIECIVKNL